MGVMGLGVKQGMEVVIKCDGEQEDDAITALEAFMKENL
jgi:phosphocarrier protein